MAFEYNLPTVNPNLTPQSQQQQQALLAQALANQTAGDSTAPIQSPWQGIARLAQAGLGAFQNYQVGQNARSNQAALAKSISDAGIGAPPAPAASVTPAGSADAGDTAAAPSDQSASNALPQIASGLPAYYAKVASIEDPSGDPTATSPTGASGLFQFTKDTWGDHAPAGASRADPKAQVAAVQDLTQDNHDTLAEGLGREPTAGELYLAHQQGAGGALKLLQNPNETPASLGLGNAVAVNNGDPNAPASQFAQKWTSRFAGVPSPFAQGSAAPATVPAAVSSYAGPTPSPVAGAPASQALASALQEGRSAAVDPDATGSIAPPAVAPQAPGLPAGTHMSQLPGPPLLLSDQNSGPANPLAAAIGSAAGGGAPAPGAAPAASLASVLGGGNVSAQPSPAPGGVVPPAVAPGAGAVPAVGQPPAATRQQALMSILANPGAPQALQQVAAQQLEAMNKDQTVSAGSSVYRNGQLLYTAPDKEAASKWQVIGEDQYGNKTYGYPPAAGSAAAAGGAPAAGAPGAVDQSLRGQAVLDAIPDAGTKAQVQSVIEGRANLPQGPRMNGHQQMIADLAQRADPTLESGSSTARVAMQRNATSGPMAISNNALNTTIGHLGELSDAAEKLNTGNYPMLNSVENFGKTQTGNPAVTNFNNIVGPVAEEATRAYRGAGGAESDISRVMEGLSPNSSPAQIQGAIGKITDLLGSKIRANQDQYTGAMGPLAAKPQMIAPRSQSTLDALQARATAAQGGNPLPPIPGISAAPAGGAPAAPAPAPSAAPAAPAVGEVQKGYRFRGGDPSAPTSWEKAS